jgi:hypothetical protein
MGDFPARGESLARSAIVAAFERLFLFSGYKPATRGPQGDN